MGVSTPTRYSLRISPHSSHQNNWCQINNSFNRNEILQRNETHAGNVIDNMARGALLEWRETFTYEIHHTHRYIIYKAWVVVSIIQFLDLKFKHGWYEYTWKTENYELVSPPGLPWFMIILVNTYFLRVIAY